MTTAVPTDHTVPAAPEAAAPMTHREVLEALSGLLIGMFVAMLSSTVVTNALPTIIGDLGGGESAYTWVITATLLTTTATTPIWGKLADLFSRKMLVQVALVIFVAGSAMAGLAPGIGWLIGARAVQGIGVGGLTALVQVVMAAMIAPRERGRYSGYLGATFALATISGPLLGGLIVDTSWLGWRWCFYIGVPFAIATSGARHTAGSALAMLGLPDDVPVVTRDLVERAKPDPHLFLAAARRLDVDPRNCFVVGDSVWDLLAAQRAGALGIGLLSGGYGREELERSGAYRVYADPAEMLTRLEEVGVRPVR